MKVEYNKVYNTDVFKLIPFLEDNSIDLVVTDPPYGDGIGYGRNGKTILNNEDESINYQFIDGIIPKMKMNTSLYLFSNHKFFDKIKNYAISKGLNYRMTCILVKNNIGMGYGFRNQYEVCLIFEKGKASYNLKNVSNVWRMKHINHDDNTHPHKKDNDIMKRIILHSSNEGDLVFDGFMGSFTTAKVCQELNRKFIGSELDKKWFDIGQKELNTLKQQQNPFTL